MMILVTGASGIVGRPLVRTLLKRGHRVVALCRHPEENGSDRNLRWLSGDVGKPCLGLTRKQWQELSQEIDAIFHLAARTDFRGRELADYESVNIRGVENIKALARAAGAWLHHVSTAFVCGIWDGEFREDFLSEEQSFRNCYEESKYLGECVLRREPLPGFSVYRPAIILERRPTTLSPAVFGPLVFLDAVFRLCLAANKRDGSLETIRVAGNPAAHLPFVFDDEVAQSLADLAEKEQVSGETYNLVPALPLGNNSLQDVFNQAFSREAVRWVDDDDFLRQAPSTAERILAKKTRMYAPYLNLQTSFSRENLEKRLGKAVLTAIGEDELLASFSFFLSSKQEPGRQAAPVDSAGLENYFSIFLRQHIGKALIRNLASLSVCFHIRINGYGAWTIRVEKGILTTVSSGACGNFGYSTDAGTFLQIASAKMSPQKGFFKGAVQLLENPREALRTATALEEFFYEYPYQPAP